MFLIGIILSIALGFVFGCGVLKYRDFEKIGISFALYAAISTAAFFVVFGDNRFGYLQLLYPMEMNSYIKAVYCFIVFLWCTLFFIYLMKNRRRVVEHVVRVAFGKHLNLKINNDEK